MNEPVLIWECLETMLLEEFLILVVIPVGDHIDLSLEVFHSFFPYKNSLVRKSGKGLFSPLIWTISNSKHDNNACHLAKICLETRFSTSFFKTLGAALQSVLIKNALLNKS